MTNIPSNSPIDIRALVLYDIHQWKTTKNSYKNYEKMCEVMRNETISYEEYESFFNKFLEESYYSTRDKSSTDIPIPDIRGCILSNVINGKSAEKSIEDLCNAFKHHKIDKEDHDYWFKRFENGHLFNRVMFSDFPEDVFAEIVGKCDIKSYFNLRNVSFGLRTIIDQLAPPCTAIEVTCGHTGIKFLVNRSVLADSHFLEKANRNQPMEAFEKRIPESLTLLLRNRKLRLKYFTFYSFYSDQETHSYIKTVINLLNSSSRKIYVENCSIGVGSTEDLIGILQCLKPGTLEKIYLTGHFARIDINKIVEMVQWKQAKHLESEDLVLPSIEHLLHFSTVEASVVSSSLEDVIQLCEALSKSPSKAINFESFTLETESETQMDTAVKSVLNLQPTASPQIYSIPNTNLVIQFECPYRWNWNLQVLKIYKN
ncbi:hypothetical protein CRE_11430 [Caenorhabditis remanei]|uniref:F-box domain-containing protein n=1 Tax=Caenorhabditis remanei TaxID=31234 RepID=E3NBG1_CAERE|nr:hypothetical protein CRE_11430 [Caenorhabditis remanei]